MLPCLDSAKIDRRSRELNRSGRIRTIPFSHENVLKSQAEKRANQLITVPVLKCLEYLQLQSSSLHLILSDEAALVISGTKQDDLKLRSLESRNMIRVNWFEGNMFRLNMFVIALSTSDAGFKQVSCKVV